MTIEAKVIKGVTQEIIDQRNLAYPSFNSPNPEEFDIDCESFMFLCNGELMTVGRIRSSYNGSIFKESLGHGLNSKDSVDMERYFVVAQFRGIENLYEFFVLSSFDYIISKGFKYGQSALRPGRRLQERLLKLHFDIDLNPIPMHYSSGFIQDCYPVTIDFEKQRGNILSDLEALKSHFEKEFTFIKSY